MKTNVRVENVKTIGEAREVLLREAYELYTDEVYVNMTVQEILLDLKKVIVDTQDLTEEQERLFELA